MKKIPYYLDKHLSAGNICLVVFIVASLFFYPVIAAGVFFQDDAERATSLKGDHGFIDGGRFVAEGLSRIMSGFNGQPVDFGSFGQILGVISLVISVLLLLRYKLDFSVRSLIVALPLIINPFLLHNASYRFDSFGMLLGYALAITAFTFFTTTLRGFIISALLLFVSFGLYQSMPNVFLMLTALEFVHRTIKPESDIYKALKDIALKSLAFAFGLVLYLLVTAFIFPIKNSRNKANLGIESISENIRAVYSLLADFYQLPLFIPVALAVFLSLSVAIVTICKGNNWTYRLPLMIIGVIALLSTFLGPLLFTENAIIAPRSISTMVVLVLFSGTSLLLLRNRLETIQVVLVCLLLVVTFQSYVFSYSYGAFLTSQAAYQRLILESAYNAIQIHELDGTFYSIGSSDLPISSQKISDRYPILKKNFWKRSALNNPSWTERLLRNYGLNIKTDWNDNYPDKQQLVCSKSLSPAIEARNFVIYSLPTKSDESPEHLIVFRENRDFTFCE